MPEETDEDISDYKIVDPPDEPEEDDFKNVLPGPTEEVRFDDGFTSRRRYSRQRRRPSPRQRRTPQPAPTPAQKTTGRKGKPVLVAAMIVLAVVLAAVAAFVIFGRG